MADDATAATPACPPHRWFIEAEYKPEGSTETWTCAYCHETKTVIREKDLPKPPWVVGREGKSNPRPVPADAPEPASDAVPPVPANHD